MNFAERVTQLEPEGAYEVLARAQALEAAGRDIIHLEIGQPAFLRHLLKHGTGHRLLDWSAGHAGRHRQGGGFRACPDDDTGGRGSGGPRHRPVRGGCGRG